MKLKLRYPPTPEYAPDHAELGVAIAKEISGVNLDYSVESLCLLDDIIEGFRREGLTTTPIARALFAFGCYVGQVFVRQSNGRWRNAKDTPFRQIAGFPIVIQLGPSNFVNPIGKVFKRLENGKEEYLPYFYQVFTSQARIEDST